MKNYCAFFLMLISATVGAQTAPVRNPEYQVDFEFALLKPLSSVTISRYNSPNVKDKTIIFKTSSKKCFGTGKLFLKFANGDSTELKNVVLSCGPYTGDTPNLSAAYVFPDKFYEKMNLEELISFNIDGVEVPMIFKEERENLWLLFDFSDK